MSSNILLLLLLS